MSDFQHILLLGQFASEFILRLWSCGFISRFHGPRGRLRYLLHPLRILDLIIVTASIYSILTFQVNQTTVLHWPLCFIRAINVLRLLSLDRTLSSLRAMGQSL